MKKCTYCGKEQPQEATVCAFDGQPLVDPDAPKPTPTENQTDTPKKRKLSYGIVLLIIAVLHIRLLMSGALVDTIASTGSIIFAVIETI